MMRRTVSAVLVMLLLAGMTGMEAFASEEVPSPAVQEGEESELPDMEAEPSPTPEAQVPPEEVVEEPSPTETPKPALPPVIAVPPLPEEVEEEPQEEIGTDDPLYYKIAYAPMTISAIPSSYKDVTPRTLKSGEVLHKGVDVSEYQSDIDWTKVKAAGIDFAIIRVAYRGAQLGTLGKDTKYAQNLKNARAAGVKVGAYFFSQATTEEEAREEARYLVNIVRNYSIDLPLVFDYEEVPTVKNRRLVMEDLDRQLKTDIANAFCSEVEKYGYRSMVYTNLSMLGSDLYPAQMGRIWLAHWTKKTTYTGNYEYWQFGIGKVNGIPSEVDLDYWYETLSAAVPPSEGIVTPASPTPSPTPTPSQGTTSFSDVKSGDWFYDAVQWASGKGIVSGLGDGRFNPQGTASRAHVVTMIYRMKGQPKVSKSAGFTDLKEEYYKAPVNWAAATGIVKGTGGTSFSPDGKITRQDLVTLLYRMEGSPTVSGSLSGFTDADSVQGYASSAVIWAVSKGLVKGYDDGTIRPAASATRAEVCTLLKRLSEQG